MSDRPDQINLLPVAYRARIAKRRAIARWSVAIGVITLLAYAPAGAIAMNARSSIGPTTSRIDRARNKLDRIASEQPGLEARLVKLQTDASVYAVVEDRIDWRSLLGSIASSAPPARFERIELAARPNDQRIHIHLSGMTDTISDAREFVLRLEESGVYESVSLANSSAVGLPNADVIRFEIRAIIGAGEETP